MSTTAQRPASPGSPREKDSTPRGGGQMLPLLVIALALAAAGVGALIVRSSYDEPQVAVTLGKNLAINPGAASTVDLNANNSPTLVRNPVDQPNLVATNRIDSPRYSCAVHASFDGGGRWTQTPIPVPPGEEPKCFAPDAAFTGDGTLYVSFVTLKGRANSPNAVWLARSTDGGRTLTAPIKTPLPARSFQVRLTGDPHDARRLYLTWLQAEELGLYSFSTTGNPIMAMRSDDGGRNWTDPARVSAASRERVVAPSPAAGDEEGELYVLYLDLKDDVLDYAGGHRGRGGAPYAGEWELVLSRSEDNGASWSEKVVDSTITPTERFVVFTPPFPSIAVDQDSGRVYAAFQDGRDGNADVLLWSLPANGADVDGPVRVNDTPEGDTTAQYLPVVSVADNGRVDVMYYDRREDNTNVLNDVSLQASFDEGKTFLKHVRVSDRAFSSRIGSGLDRELPDLGSRLALVSSDRLAYGVWTDTRNGSVRTAKQDLARGIVAFNDPPRLSSAADAALLIGGIAALIAAGGVGVLAIARRRRTV